MREALTPVDTIGAGAEFRMRRRRARHVAWLAALVLTTSAQAAERPRGFHVAGGDTFGWIVSTTADRDSASQLPLIHVLAARRVGTGELVTPLWRAFEPIVGDVRATCADRERLYLQFGDGSFSVFDAEGSTPGGRLPREVRLSTWTGDNAGTAAYAVVTPAPDSAASAPASPRGTKPTVRLARFDGHEWTMSTELPRDAREAGAWRLAVSNERVLLVWVDRVDASADWRIQGVLRCVEWSKDAWGAPQTIAEIATARLLHAAWPSRGPVVLVRDRLDGDAKTAGVRLFERGASDWRDCGWVNDGGKPARADDAEWTMAHGRILAARVGAMGGVEAAWGTIGKSPSLSWAPASGGGGAGSSWWMAWLNSLATFAMIGFLFFLRPERLTAPAKLPADMAVAMPVKRLLATLIDFAPAALMTAYWWAPPFLIAAQRAPLMEPEQIQELQRYVETVLWWPKLAMLAVYGAYCFACEALSGTTPGKHLLGCRVVDENGNRPTLGQVAIRNVLRVFELAINLMMLATLFLMLIASQRRQRIGDMLAGTMVVGHAIPKARPLGQHPRGPGGGPSGGERG